MEVCKYIRVTLISKLWAFPKKTLGVPFRILVKMIFGKLVSWFLAKFLPWLLWVREDEIFVNFKLGNHKILS